ncbi:hypothetical protein MA16_Dca007838 [Dendrobium catenatum]|uniref:F-box domain-containing protein n=1 Tax=Dendrobium catenatum TaxID=906689 RepID=A0A2I0XJ00_9ASPA|nr:hypothetical protein MA16_Dca007838 [Dendrobium catenatum]
MSSSWSDLPLDLLISIRKKLPLHANLFSFRSVCSQWHYASPIPHPCPLYEVKFNEVNNIIRFTLGINDDIYREHFVSLPFSSSFPISLFSRSNGWLIFKTRHNEILHLFDPVSNRKLIFPPLCPKFLRYYRRVKPTAHDVDRVSLWKVVASSSSDASIAVACIVEIKEKASVYPDRRFVFCRHAHGDCLRWSFLMEESKGIMDIALAGDGRFYAVGKDCKFYMLDERPPIIKLMKIKLWLPRHILDSEFDDNPPTKRVLTSFHGLKASGETNLDIYAAAQQHRYEMPHIALKINLPELHANCNNIYVVCDASVCDASRSYGPRRLHNDIDPDIFRPSLSGTSFNIQCQTKDKNELHFGFDTYCD